MKTKLFMFALIACIGLQTMYQHYSSAQDSALQPDASVAVSAAPAVSAQGDSGQKWWQNLLVTIITAMLTVATPIITVLIMALIKKWNLKIEQDKIDWVLEKAKGYAEQYAKNKLKDGQPVTGPEVAKVAVEYGSKLAAMYSPKLADYLAELIEAKLGQDVIASGGAQAVMAANSQK